TTVGLAAVAATRRVLRRAASGELARGGGRLLRHDAGKPVISAWGKVADAQFRVPRHGCRRNSRGAADAGAIGVELEAQRVPTARTCLRTLGIRPLESRQCRALLVVPKSLLFGIACLAWPRSRGGVTGRHEL